MEPEPDRGRRLLCFGAHPDDCEIKSAGLAALWTRAGGQARFVALTDGSAGHHEMVGEALVRRRRAEAAAGARAAGADSVILDNADGMLMPTLENRFRVIREIRLFRPDVIVCPRTNDYHPDHRTPGSSSPMPATCSRCRTSSRWYRSPTATRWCCSCTTASPGPSRCGPTWW